MTAAAARKVLFETAKRFKGQREIAGLFKNNPVIMKMLRLDAKWPENDEVPWCAAFVNFCAFICPVEFERSRSLRARDWMKQGFSVKTPAIGDVVVFWRGKHDDGASGHVGFFAGSNKQGSIYVLGGNQGNAVSIKKYSRRKLLGFRRLRPKK